MKVGKRVIAMLSCMVLCLGSMAGCSKKKEVTTSEPELKEESVEKTELAVANLGCYVEEQIGEPEYQEGEYSTSFFMGQNGNLKIITSQYIMEPIDQTQQADAESIDTKRAWQQGKVCLLLRGKNKCYYFM